MNGKTNSSQMDKARPCSRSPWFSISHFSPSLPSHTSNCLPSELSRGRQRRSERPSFPPTPRETIALRDYLNNQIRSGLKWVRYVFKNFPLARGWGLMWKTINNNNKTFSLHTQVLCIKIFHRRFVSTIPKTPLIISERRREIAISDLSP